MRRRNAHCTLHQFDGRFPEARRYGITETPVTFDRRQGGVRFNHDEVVEWLAAVQAAEALARNAE